MKKINKTLEERQPTYFLLTQVKRNGVTCEKLHGVFDTMEDAESAKYFLDSEEIKTAEIFAVL